MSPWHCASLQGSDTAVTCAVTCATPASVFYNRWRQSCYMKSLAQGHTAHLSWARTEMQVGALWMHVASEPSGSLPAHTWLEPSLRLLCLPQTRPHPFCPSKSSYPQSPVFHPVSGVKLFSELLSQSLAGIATSSRCPLCLFPAHPSFKDLTDQETLLLSEQARFSQLVLCNAFLSDVGREFQNFALKFSFSSEIIHDLSATTVDTWEFLRHKRAYKFLVKQDKTVCLFHLTVKIAFLESFKCLFISTCRGVSPVLEPRSTFICLFFGSQRIL